MDRKYLSLLLILGILTAFTVPAVSAETSAPLPPDPSAAAAAVPKDVALPPDPSPEIKPATQTVPYKPPSGSVKPGPLEAERKQMLVNINAAEELGVGVKGYMVAFQFMEEMVASGASEEKIQERLDSLKEGLTEQLERKQFYKERPAAPPPSQQPATGASLLMHDQNVPPSLRFGGMGGSVASPEMIKELQAKYGNRLPAGMSADSLKNPGTRDMIKDQIKNNPQALEMLKQLLNK